MSSDVLKNAMQYIREHPSLNGLIQLVILASIVFVAYRILKSPRFTSFRSKIPGLDQWYGKREIRHLIASGEYAKAGDRLLGMGQLNHAIKVFEQGNLSGRAADVYLKLGNHQKAAMLYEKAGEHGTAAQIYLELKQYDRAEKCFEKTGKREETGDLFRQHGEYKLAANAYLKFHQYDKAAETFLELKQPTQAADAFVKAFEQKKSEGYGSDDQPLKADAKKLLQNAAKLYEQAGQHEEAAKWYTELDQQDAAARCYLAMGDTVRAADIYEEGGNLEKAAELLAKVGDEKSALRLRAEHFYDSGNLQDAIANFQSAGDFVRAGEIYRELQLPDKAAQMYERAGEYSLAGSLFSEVGRHEDAGRCYERAEEWQEAIDSYREGKIPEKEYRVLEKIEDFIGMADNLIERNLPEEALEVIAPIGKNDPRYRKALSLRGKIAFNAGKTSDAKAYYEESLAHIERLESPDLDDIYNLAQVEDPTQEESKAISTLERMLAKDLVNDDIVEKAQTLRKMLTDRASSKLSRLSMTPASLLFGKEASAEAPSATKPKLNRYKLIKEIGRGGMGVVYTAKDSTLDRVVALKILSSAYKKNQQAVSTFLREGKAAARLNHPYIVTVHDAGTQMEDYYIAMELIEGQTLKQILKAKGKLNYESVNKVIHQLLDALDYAHSKNVVHRDLTNNNIMWTRQKTIKIMDFGLAKIVKELEAEQSIVGGTPSYMSPEQTLGDPIDHRTDIYSLGICIYEMALGELPFKKGDMGYHHLHTPPPDPKTKDPNLPDVLSHIILGCMEKEPKKRFQSVKEIQNLLEMSQ